MRREPVNRFQLTVQPAESACDAPASLSLLEAALAAGIRLPNSCRNGTCRTCLCRLIEGRVKYRIEWPGVSAEERAESLILPCVVLPESDVVIDVPGAEKA
jgi:ferredoxin